MRRLLMTWIAGSIAVASPSAADNWPEFRGPTGQGIVPRGPLPIEWGTDKNVAWKQAIPGTGWSSPVVDAGRIYLTTSLTTTNRTGGELSLAALCLDAKTGKRLWQTDVFRHAADSIPRIHSKNSHASPTPIINGQRLYVHFGHLGTAALDLSGNVLWRNTALKYAPVHGSGGSPVLVGDMLVLSCDGADRQLVVALDAKTGDVRWKTDRRTAADKTFSFGTPLAIEFDGRPQIISPGSDVVNAYDPRTGREIWRVRYEGYSVIPRPVFGHGLAFVCTGYGSPRLIAIRPDGQGDVTESHVAWTLSRGAPLTPSPLLVGDELYLVSDLGVASCLDAKTGRVHWQRRLGGNFSSSPLFAAGNVYFQDEDGTTTVLQAGQQFAQVAQNSLEEPTLASHAAADGALFIRTKSRLYRIEAPASAADN